MLQEIPAELSATHGNYLQHTALYYLQLLCNKKHVHCSIPATSWKCCRKYKSVADNTSAIFCNISATRISHLQYVADLLQILLNHCLQHIATNWQQRTHTHTTTRPDASIKFLYVRQTPKTRNKNKSLKLTHDDTRAQGKSVDLDLALGCLERCEGGEIQSQFLISWSRPQF